VKFTLQGTIRVEVRDHPSDSGCCIVVRDTGVGIAEPDLKRLGERFFRADTARGRTVEGAGIGLSLVRGLVKLQNGSIEIDSKLEVGTTVTVCLPPSAHHTPVAFAPAGLAENPYVAEASQWLSGPAAPAVPAALGNLTQLRNSLRSWLATIAVDPVREQDILLATGEAVTNAIEHASGGDPHRTVAVEAFVYGDKVSATVSDSGRWSGDSSASARSYRRGRGLTLINGLADRVDTVRTARGTQMTLQFERAVRSTPESAGGKR
jgi:anti-sigma regulatory factor (Ser/Thr protein kinase)